MSVDVLDEDDKPLMSVSWSDSLLNMLLLITLVFYWYIIIIIIIIILFHVCRRVGLGWQAGREHLLVGLSAQYAAIN